MLKSLKKLKAGCWFPPGKDIQDPDYFDTKNIVDEIQTEIDRFYLPRPLFEDGEPVQFDDNFIADRGTEHEVKFFAVSGEGVVFIGDGGWMEEMEPGKRLKRPPESDTQEKIDADATLSPRDYAIKYIPGCNYFDAVVAVEQMVKHLLARQRKLDGVE